MNLRSYVLVTAAYWAFTITDGALRMLVLLHFHDLGYGPVTLAFLFLFYEAFGVGTNLVGGWLGSRFGLERTLFAGLALQVVALTLLTLQDVGWATWVSVAYVMALQALSGIAKDLTKMSSKSAIKLVVGDEADDDHQSRLFHWVAVLTGSKNALKGVGFFIGGALLAWIGYDSALLLMAAVLAAVLVTVVVLLDASLGKAKAGRPLRSVLSKSAAINRLSLARLFLFAARDIWFVVALPIYLDEQLGWSFEAIGGFLAAWVIGYGIVQSLAPRLIRADTDKAVAATRWALVLATVTVAMAIAVNADRAAHVAVLGGLVLFGMVFAVNSSLHSYLILAYSTSEDVALDVGFYYSANATGRLVGTLLSGVLYLAGGLPAALWGSALFVIVTWALSRSLPSVRGAGLAVDDSVGSPLGLTSTAEPQSSNE